MDKEKIRKSVKTSFSKYGLKDSSIDKLVNIVADKITAMGTIENEDEVIKSEVDLAEPYIAIIQPEIDAYRAKSEAKTEVVTDPKTITESENLILAELKKISERQDRLEQADAAKSKQAQRSQLIENIRKSALTKDAANEKSGWASNAGVLNMALQLIQIEDTDTEETISQKCQAEYNKRYVETFGKSDSVPGVGGGGSAETTDWSEEKKRLQERGSLPKD